MINLVLLLWWWLAFAMAYDLVCRLHRCWVDPQQLLGPQAD